MTEELHKNPEYPADLPYRRVLDHGFVALVDAMGNDASIVQAARVSYGKGTKTVRSDQALISYLLRHAHTTPFEMVEFKFLMRLPVFVARQLIRHRTASVNEYSGRYSEVPDRFWAPAIGALAEQDTVNRQGRSDMIRELADALPEPKRRTPCAYEAGEAAVLVAKDGTGIGRRALRDASRRAAFLPHWAGGAAPGGMLPSEAYVYWVEELLRHFPERRRRLEALRAEFERQNRDSYALYRRILEGGVAREIARCVLPLSMYTEWYWKVDLHNLLHFLRLRMDPHAQLEIRAFAEAVAEFVKERVPHTWDAFESEVLRGTRVSDAELSALRPADGEAQREVLRALHARGYRERRLKETCRKLGIDESLVDELWPPKPR